MKESDALLSLAARAGLQARWIDAAGVGRDVQPDTLRAVLGALDLPASSAPEVAESNARLDEERAHPLSLSVVRNGEFVSLTGLGRRARISSEDGSTRALTLRAGPEGRAGFSAPRQPGYYRIDTGAAELRLAVAPARCLRPRDIAPGRRLSGVAVQIYALRGGRSGAFGDFASLGALARAAGRNGLDVAMASPTHALFGADAGRFSPYSPSTRYFFNSLFADATIEGGPALQDSSAAELIDWPSAAKAKMRTLEVAFVAFEARKNYEDFGRYCREGGQRLLNHALFESLDAHFRARGISGFRNWPAGFRSPGSTGAQEFLISSQQSVRYQMFLQWLTERSAAAAQKSARQGMAVGIVSDIAIGMNPEGSHAWSAPEELLRGLHVGAPPDIFNTRGQDWGLTTISPRALVQTGFAGFIDTLRANMRHAGGVRLDHAMGLRRLWVIPAGAAPSEGVYLDYPERDLLNLIALESRRARAIVIGEDLGTVPDGFRGTLSRAGILGMQVLWFERDADGRFLPPRRWRSDAVGLTTTHDLPTVSGWWSGRDIDWRARVGQLGFAEDAEWAARAKDRAQLWSACRNARCANGAAPPATEPEKAIGPALSFIGKSRSALAIAAIEDILGEREQPNLPGTTDEHPNWRRRLPPGDLLDNRFARATLDALTGARRRS